MEREVFGVGGVGAWGDQGSLIFWAEISVDLRHRTAQKVFLWWLIWVVHKVNLNFTIWQYCLVEVELVPWQC
jgi:hypothetical protein